MGKKRKVEKAIVPVEFIQSKIYIVRGLKVMLDRDLARLYGVETRRLNEQVKRNIKRFPEDFMFQLTKKEFNNWKSQIAMTNSEKMGLRRNPYAFTEQEVAMLSSVLNSERAILVNIQIMRTFTKLRKMIVTYQELKNKIESLERKYDKHEEKIQTISEFIKQMISIPEKPRRQIGFKATNNKK